MPEQLFRRQVILDSDAPAVFQVLWGPDGPNGRAVIEAEDNLSDPGGLWDRMKCKVGAKDGYHEKLASGEWLLTDHGLLSGALSARDYVEIMDRTAHLRGGRIIHTNTELRTEAI